MATATRVRYRRTPAGGNAVRAEQAERHLGRFIRQAWDTVEPGTPFVSGWHLDVIADHLEAISSGELLKLIINVPPRHMKSLSVAVFWPAWAWIQRPELEWVFASYARELASTHSMDCRRLIESEWYQQRWGDRFALAVDENRKMRFENDHGGVRHATSVGGTVTGMGGHVRVYDDPHKIEEVESDEQREKVANWRDKTMASRTAGDPAKAAEVLVMQRLHEEDLTGHLIEKGGWTHLCLPAEYEPRHPFVWPDDPRSEAGEILWQGRYTEAVLDDAKLDLGSYGYAGQYQQRPTPAEGGILKRDWWRLYDSVPDFQQVVQSWDMAFEETDDTDYVVGQVWGRDLANLYLVAQVRARLEFTKTVTAVNALNDWVEEHFGAELRGAIWVENKANGPAVISQLRSSVQGLVPIDPKGGKEARARAVSPLVEAGNVFLPAKVIPCPAVIHKGERLAVRETTTEEFVEECAGFPRGSDDDQVDACTQALIRLKGTPKRKVRTGGRDSRRSRRRRA